MFKTPKSRTAFIKTLATFAFILLPWLFAFIYVKYLKDDTQEHEISVTYSKSDNIQHVDHSKFEILKQKFESPQDVTEACLSCHNKTAEDIMNSSHWNWEKKDIMDGKEVVIGKKNLPNNFCIGIRSNEKLCSKCHAGYGWKDEHFNFSKSKNIDCLICHDNTGKYKKSSPGKPMQGSGLPEPDIDLSAIASHVGETTKENCGSCHFSGGGGNNVKHGDLESALTDKKISIRENAFATNEGIESQTQTGPVDVHMSVDGKNMNCTECHKTSHHNISGNMYTVSSSNENPVTCEQCHGASPHSQKILNTHYNTIACQTCHIPVYAKVNPTTVLWDWSTAGNQKKGSPSEEEGEMINDTQKIFHAKHGNMTKVKNAKPDYIWFNGNAHLHMFDDKITSDTVVMNKLYGSYEDHINPTDPLHPSKIYPVKIMRGKQPYDTENKTLIQPNNVGPKGSGAFWADFDKQKSFKIGMDSIGLPYSGKYDYINTESYWPLNHMVSSSENALSCKECHSRDGRLASLQGFYIPGRDRSNIVEYLGIILIIGSILGVLIHALIRFYSSKKK